MKKKDINPYDLGQIAKETRKPDREKIIQLTSTVKELEREVERRNEIIQKLFSGGMKLTIGMWEDTDPKKEWEDFKKQNNL